MPIPDFLLALYRPLEPHVMKGATRPHQVLAAMQMARQTLDLQIFKEVVFIREIPSRPYQPRLQPRGALRHRASLST